MSFSIEDVRWVASLARLRLTEDELEAMASQLRDIIDYVAQLQEVDTEGIEPLAHPLEVSNIFREDVLAPSLPVEVALANAPQKKNDYFAVPAVLD